MWSKRDVARRVATFAAVALAVSVSFAAAAELPSQAKKGKAEPAPQAQRTCNVGGISGVLTADGVCVRLSGYVSTGVAAGQLK
jgi:hypothetical protein